MYPSLICRQTDCLSDSYQSFPLPETILIEEATASSWVITSEGLSHHYNDTVEKSRSGNPVVRGLIYLPASSTVTSDLRFVRKGETVKSISFNSTFLQSNLQELPPDEYSVFLDNIQLEKDVKFKLGGVYTIVGANVQNKVAGRTITVTTPNSMHMMWLLPQYIIITIAEVMFSVTGLQFAFTQAPKSMKSLLQAGWLLTVAFGNLIVVIISEVSIFDRQVSDGIQFWKALEQGKTTFTSLQYFCSDLIQY